MISYHETVTPTATETVQLRPYEYPVLPPIGRVLQAIREHCDVGGTIKTSVRELAEWANYASAGRISSLLGQLANDGWILYDSDNSNITLLADSEPITARDQAAITAEDQDDENDDSEAITEGDQAIPTRDRDALIPARDRGSQRPSPLLKAITRRDQLAPRMEDHVLAAVDQESDSAATRSQIPCAADLIPTRDRFSDSPTAIVLSELGADPVTLAEIAAAQPDLTPSDILPQWDIAQEQERNGDARNARGLLFGVLKKPGGRLYGRATGSAAPDWAAYAADPQFQPSCDPLRERAERLMPPMTALNNRTWMHDFQFLLDQIGSGASDDQALDALAAFQRSRSRGAP